MGDTTKIEWADATVNWWWGCTKVSPGCANCYAETLAARFGVGWGPSAPRKMIDGAADRLERLAHKGDKTGIAPRVFMQSMSDLFEDRVDLVEPRKRLWDLLHKFAADRRRIVPMILTKRPKMMLEWASYHGWPANAWAGTTVEDQQRAEERIPDLLMVPARVRFLSCEPLLGPVSLRFKFNNAGGLHNMDTLRGYGGFGSYDPARYRIHWVIAGGESGPKARPMHPQWARSLRDQCVAAGTKFHFKQWGEWAPLKVSEVVDKEFSGQSRPVEWTGDRWLNDQRGACSLYHLGKHAAGRLLDGRTWDEVPHV